MTDKFTGYKHYPQLIYRLQDCLMLYETLLSVRCHYFIRGSVYMSVWDKYSFSHAKLGKCLAIWKLGMKNFDFLWNWRKIIVSEDVTSDKAMVSVLITRNVCEELYKTQNWDHLFLKILAWPGSYGQFRDMPHQRKRYLSITVELVDGTN